MALSQIQCLDDNHVNPRTSENKPEFFYCEDQRLALEALLQNGREAFFKYLESRGLRGFLSDLELQTLTQAAEPFDPSAEVFQEDQDDDPTPLSLHYWPELSDTSIPQMDLGWPDCSSYRGVTRTCLYTQPPLDGQAHIKEVIRRTIAQAQKVIAVAMDVFTDVDIYRDLLDAGFKRKVSTYILLERTAIPHFLSMCQRANMHAGHLKHLRVRCSEGAEFFTRHCTKIRGQMGHRFMLIDGDKAVSGSYSFTWTSSRLDRNLITVTTGQAVDSFDRLFCSLYMSSSAVDMQQIATNPEPESELRTHISPVVAPSAAVLRKLHNPKYALVALNNYSAPLSSGNNNSTTHLDVATNPKKRTQRDKPTEDPFPLHPGLTHLEKAYLIPYLPTWPEPEPASDVIGFINVRDAKRPVQVHLQRSEMFETSQAIRFSSPVGKPQENIAEVTAVSQASTKHEETCTPQPVQETGKGEEPFVNLELTKQHLAPGDNSRRNIEPSVKTEKYFLNTDSGFKEYHVSAHPHNQPDTALGVSNNEKVLHKEYISTNNGETRLIPDVSKKARDISSMDLIVQSDVGSGLPTLESDSAQKHKPSDLCDSNIMKDILDRTMAPQKDLEGQSVNIQFEDSSKMTPQLPATNQTPISTAPNTHAKFAFYSRNNPKSISTSRSSSASSPCSNVSSPTSTPALPSGSTLGKQNALIPAVSPSALDAIAEGTPIIQACTVQWVIDDSGLNKGKTPSEIGVNSRSETSEGPRALYSKFAFAAKEETSLLKKDETAMMMSDMSNCEISQGNEKDATSNSNKSLDLVFIDESDACMDCCSREQSTVQSESLGSNTENTGFPSHREHMSTGQDSKTQSNSLSIEHEATELSNSDSKDFESKQARAVAPHALTRVSYGNSSKDNHKVNSVGFIKLQSNDTPHKLSGTKSGHYKTNPTSDRIGLPNAQSQLTLACSTVLLQKQTDANRCITSQEQSGKAQEDQQTPVKICHVRFPGTRVPGVYLPLHDTTVEPSRTSNETARGLSLTLSTSPTQTTRNEPQSFSPDPQTPTSDVSDGCVSPNENSTQSTTSEEYFDCRSSPLYEPSIHQQLSSGKKDNTINSDASDVTSVSPSSYSAFDLGVAPVEKFAARPSHIRTSTPSRSQIIFGPSPWRGKRENGEEATTKKDIRKEYRKENTVNVMATLQGFKEANQWKGKEPPYLMKPFTEDHSSQKMANAIDYHYPKKAGLPLKLRSASLGDSGRSKEEMSSQKTPPRRSPTFAPKLKTVFDEEERVAKTSQARGNPARIGGEEMTERLLIQEAEMQKLVFTPAKAQGLQLQDSRISRQLSSSRPPLTAQVVGGRTSRSFESEPTESRVFHNSHQATQRRPQSRTPSPSPGPATSLTGVTAGQRQTTQRQHRLSLQIPPPAQTKSKPSVQPSNIPCARPRTSFLHAYMRLHTQADPQTPNHPASTQKGNNQEEKGGSPSTLAFSRLEAFKSLKDKMSKLSTPGKKGSTPVRARQGAS